MIADLMRWSARRWVIAMTAAVAVAVLIGLPTDVIPNPVFGRPVPVTWWSYPVLVVTALLGGLLTATYVGQTQAPAEEVDRLDRSVRGGLGGLLSFFAVGCPVCNKLVVAALGTVGSRRWFEPFQPVLAVLSIVLLVIALRGRMKNATSCPVSLRA